ncbi:MAG: hypothetical protein ABI280_04070 [Ginsengibacter sp.]
MRTIYSRRWKGLISLGATECQPMTDRTDGFIIAAVVDPFGNILSNMYKPHYLKSLTLKNG